MDCSPGISFFPEVSDSGSDGATTSVTKPKFLSHKSTLSASSCSTYEGDVATWSEDEASSPLSQSSGRALFKSSFQDQQVVVHKTFVEREDAEDASNLLQGCRPARRSASCPPRIWGGAEKGSTSPLKRSAAVFDPALVDSEEWASWEAAMSMEFSDSTWPDATMADTIAWYLSAEDPAAWQAATEGTDYNWDVWAAAMDAPEGWEAPLERPRAPASWMPPPPPPPPVHDAPAAAPVEPRVKLNLSFAIEEEEENEENDEPSTEQANPDDPRLGTAELPTAGSAAHYLGNCKPCAFVNRNCARGTECSFCHLCGPDERKRRRKEKIAFLRQLRRTREDVARPRWLAGAKASSD